MEIMYVYLMFLFLLEPYGTDTLLKSVREVGVAPQLKDNGTQVNHTFTPPPVGVHNPLLDQVNLGFVSSGTV